MTLPTDRLKLDSQRFDRTLKPTVFWRIGEDIPVGLKWGLMALSAIVPLTLWWIVSSLPGVESVFLPSPVEVGRAFISLGRRGFLATDTLASFGRVMGGFLLAAIVLGSLGHRHGNLCQHSGTNGTDYWDRSLYARPGIRPPINHLSGN